MRTHDTVHAKIDKRAIAYDVFNYGQEQQADKSRGQINHSLRCKQQMVVRHAAETIDIAKAICGVG